jgi:hypothetical protein
MGPTRLALLFGCLSVAPASAGDPPYRHAYYLFESAGPDEASASYVPLLVTRVPIEGGGEIEAAVLTTYERDAVWALEPRTTTVPADAVDAKTRKIRFRDKAYRYQAASAEEVVRLLKEPEGETPLHRREPPIGRESEALRDALLSDLAPARDREASDGRGEARTVTVEELNRWIEEGNYHLVRKWARGCEIEAPVVVGQVAQDGVLIVSLPGGRWKARVLNLPKDAALKAGDSVTLRGLIVSEAFAHLWIWTEDWDEAP